MLELQQPFENQTIQNTDVFSGLQMVFDKMDAICADFKLLGFRISEPILNLVHLQPNLFLTIQNPD